jgi:WXG100 family type VII secretion target
MSGLIRVTPEQLSSVSSQLNGGAANIDSIGAQLAGQVSPLGSDWAGAGQMQFQAAWEQWQTAQRNLHQALETIAGLMSRASVSYAENDQTVGSSFGKL